eukprot:1031685-Rhodomonas_salina.1
MDDSAIAQGHAQLAAFEQLVTGTANNSGSVSSQACSRQVREEGTQQHLREQDFGGMGQGGSEIMRSVAPIAVRAVNNFTGGVKVKEERTEDQNDGGAGGATGLVPAQGSGSDTTARQELTGGAGGVGTGGGAAAVASTGGTGGTGPAGASGAAVKEEGTGSGGRLAPIPLSGGVGGTGRAAGAGAAGGSGAAGAAAERSRSDSGRGGGGSN